MNTLLQDLRFSVRMLVKSPLFTAIAIITLMLGIGLNAATFSTVNGLLFKPLSGTHEPERLLQLYRHWPGMDYGSNSIPHYQDLRDRTGDVFESVAASFFTQVSLSADRNNERLIILVVSANMFQTYGVEPEIGRSFLPGIEDRDPGAHPVAVLGYAFWQARFGGDRSILGQSIDINGMPFEVVGVAPRDFKGPMSVANVEIYLPLMMQRELMPGQDRIESRGNNNMNVIARLRDGVTQQQATDALDAVLLQLAEEYPDSYENQVGTTVVNQTDAGLHPSMASAQRGMSAVMMGVVGLLLLIACLNVANLFLARARDRQREMSIRLTMGAKRSRIVRQLLTESLVFSLLAGLASLGLAFFATRALGLIKLPIDGPFVFDFGLDARVYTFTALLTIAAGLLFGLAPAIRSARSDLSVHMKPGGSVRSARIGRGLVVVQMGLSLVLLISSGLFLRSLQSAMDLDPGFRAPSNLVMASIDPGLQGYDQERTLALYERVREQAASQPNISAIGLTDTVPLSLGGSDRGVDIPGYTFAEGERQSLHYAKVSIGYLEAMGVPVLEGRTFDHTDTDSSQPILIINRRFAERFWPNDSALGQVVRTAGEDHRVVGVVETGKYRSLGEDPTEYMFFPHSQKFESGMSIVARTSQSPDEALGTLRSVIASIDPTLPVFDVRTMEDHMGIALLPARLGGTALGLFGVLGLLLAAVGIYGVMAYSVSQRQRELGIRVAIGADRTSVVRLVLGEGLKLAAIGSAAGLVAAVLTAKLVENLLYNMSALDPLTFVAVPTLLLLVASVAVYIPARKAARTDPVRVLRSE